MATTLPQLKIKYLLCGVMTMLISGCGNPMQNEIFPRSPPSAVPSKAASSWRVDLSVEPALVRIGSSQSIRGSRTTLRQPVTIAEYDGRLFVADQEANAIDVFSSDDAGNVAPIQRIVGPLTRLNRPQDLLIDASGKINVQNANTSTWIVFDLNDGEAAAHPIESALQ